MAKRKRLPRSIRPRGKAWPYKAKPRKAKRAAAAPAKPERIVVGKLSFRQAKSLGAAMLKSSSPARIHLEAALGHGNVPTIDDFDSQNAGDQTRVRAFIAYMREVLNQLEGKMKSAPVQLEMVRYSDEPAPAQPAKNGKEAPSEKKEEPVAAEAATE